MQDGMLAWDDAVHKPLEMEWGRVCFHTGPGDRPAGVQDSVRLQTPEWLHVGRDHLDLSPAFGGRFLLRLPLSPGPPASAAPVGQSSYAVLPKAQRHVEESSLAAFQHGHPQGPREPRCVISFSHSPSRANLVVFGLQLASLAWGAVFGSLTHRAIWPSQIQTSSALAAERTSRANSFDSVGPVRVRDPMSRPTKGLGVCFTASPRTTERGRRGHVVAARKACRCRSPALRAGRMGIPWMRMQRLNATPILIQYSMSRSRRRATR